MYHRPTSPPPPAREERRMGTNYDANGKPTRLPGDTVRQVITPGRIRNLAHMFDVKAKIQNEEKTPMANRRPLTIDELRIEPSEIADYHTPRSISDQDLNNNEPPCDICGEKEELIPPRKPLRSFAAEIANNDLAHGDESISHGERTLSNLKEMTDDDDEHFPLNHAHKIELPTGTYQEVITYTRKVEVFLERDASNSAENDAYSPKDSLFVSCQGEPSPPGSIKVSMLEEDDIMKKEEKSKKRRQTTVLNGLVLDPVFPVEHLPRSRTTSRGDEQSVNGHIDNLFEFVDEHLSSKQSRSSRECLYQPRFSPTAAPNVAELSQDCSSVLHGKTNKSNNSKSSKRVGSALATSTPQNSPRSTSTNQNRSRLGDDELSFVSTIQDASQVEAITHYEQMISKNEHALDRNNQQIGMLLKALTHARKERKPMQEVNAQKSLLVARERVVLLQRENKRLKALVACRRPIPNQCLEVRGSLTISNIAVHLNRNFYTRPYEINSNYSFLVMLKCGCEVECTVTHNLLAHQSTRLKVVHFDEKINFCNLPVDFCVMLEVYAMAIPEKEPETTCGSIIASKCRKILPKERPPTTSPSGFPYGEFVRCGYIQLTRDTTGTNKFYLDDVEYPLDGTVELTTHCTTLPPAIAIDYRGFLTMYQCISGMSSWERYWAVLRRGIIFFWKYPEDESMEKPPKARLDLSTCPQYEIHPCSVEQCPRPYTFTVNVLVNTAPSVMDKKRIFLSADSRHLMKDWLDAINETLAVIRGHHPYKGSILPRN